MQLARASDRLVSPTHFTDHFTVHYTALFTVQFMTLFTELSRRQTAAMKLRLF